jgi:hypothetical protein
MTAIEQQVTDEMHRRAALTEIPVPHVEQVVRDGEAVLSRRRRRIGVLGAAAAVALLVVGPWLVTLRDDDQRPVDHPPSPSPSPSASTSPVTLDDLPEGPPPEVPYLQGGSLHVDGAAIATGADHVLAAGSTILVGRVGREHVGWWPLEGHQLVPVPALDGIFDPHLSPRGDLLVWTSYPDARTTRVTAWNPETRRGVDHVDLDAPYAECCGGGQDVEIYGIDGHDAVYWSKAPGITVWRPGSGAPGRLTGPDAVMQIAPTGPMVQADGPGLLGEADEQGHLVQGRRPAHRPVGRLVRGRQADGVRRRRERRCAVQGATGRRVGARRGQRQEDARRPAGWSECRRDHVRVRRAPARGRLLLPEGALRAAVRHDGRSVRADTALGTGDLGLPAVVLSGRRRVREWPASTLAASTRMP